GAERSGTALLLYPDDPLCARQSRTSSGRERYSINPTLSKRLVPFLASCSAFARSRARREESQIPQPILARAIANWAGIRVMPQVRFRWPDRDVRASSARVLSR